MMQPTASAVCTQKLPCLVLLGAWSLFPGRPELRMTRISGCPMSGCIRGAGPGADTGRQTRTGPHRIRGLPLAQHTAGSLSSPSSTLIAPAYGKYIRSRIRLRPPVTVAASYLSSRKLASREKQIRRCRWCILKILWSAPMSHSPAYYRIALLIFLRSLRLLRLVDFQVKEICIRCCCRLIGLHDLKSTSKALRLLNG